MQERTRTLSKVQHVIDKIDARAAAKEEQARLSKEERVRIAVAGDTMRQRRRDALAGIQPPNDLVAAYQDAVEEEKLANGGTVAAIWSLHNSAQSLQAASDVLRSNRCVFCCLNGHANYHGVWCVTVCWQSRCNSIL